MLWSIPGVCAALLCGSLIQALVSHLLPEVLFTLLTFFTIYSLDLCFIIIVINVIDSIVMAGSREVSITV